MPHGVIEEDAGVPNVPAFQANQYYAANYVVQQNGLLWAANTTFMAGGAFNAANWTALTAAGVELAYAETTTQQTGITAVADLTGLTIPAFVAPARPVLVKAYIPCAQITTQSSVTLSVADGANATVASLVRVLAVGLFDLLYVERTIRTLTPGTTYNWKVRAQSNQASFQTQPVATSPCWAQVSTT